MIFLDPKQDEGLYVYLTNEGGGISPRAPSPKSQLLKYKRRKEKNSSTKLQGMLFFDKANFSIVVVFNL